MSSSDVGALVLATTASVAGVAIVLVMWHRRRRRRRVLRSRHPSVRPPLRVELVETGGNRRIRLTVPTGAPALSIDIVSFRRHDPPSPWESEPLDVPLEIAPGTSADLTSTLDLDTSAADVVVAWTARSETGPTTGSRLFRLPPERDETAPVSTGLTGQVVALLVALLVGSGTLAAASALGDDGGGTASGPEPTAPTLASDPTTASVTTTQPTDSVAATSVVTTTVASTAVATTTTSTTTTSTTTTSTTTTSTTTTSTTATSTTTVVTGEPVVVAEGRIEPCRFGDDCLVVGFTISGFDVAPAEYVCEFEDGSRFTFRFVGDGADEACATGSPTAAITVEVDGVRSETITRP